MHVRRKYSSNGYRRMAIETGLIVSLLLLAAIINIQPVKDRLSSGLTNMVLNLKAS